MKNKIYRLEDVGEIETMNIDEIKNIIEEKKIYKYDKKILANKVKMMNNIDLYDCFYIPFDSMVINCLNNIYDGETIKYNYRVGTRYSVDIYFPKQNFIKLCDFEI